MQALIVIIAVTITLSLLILLHSKLSKRVHATTNVAIATVMRKPIDLPLWLKHHRKMGIGYFFIRLEDSPGFEDYLDNQNDVFLEIGSSDQTDNYSTLQSRQVDFVKKCIRTCQTSSNLKWIFHIDADELLHGNLGILDLIDPKYKVLRLGNAEAVFDEDQKTCFSANTFLRCDLNAPCRSYANGKGGGRICNGLSIAGPHHFSFNGSHQGESVYNVPFNDLAVLHFDSCSFGAWIEKFNHLSKTTDVNNIPFSYYRESIDFAKQAKDLYSSKTSIKNVLKNVAPDKILEVPCN